jgi:hypothetical protein
MAVQLYFEEQTVSKTKCVYWQYYMHGFLVWDAMQSGAWSVA